MEFLSVPNTYYDALREQLKNSKVNIKEDLDVLQVSKTKYSIYYSFNLKFK